MRQDTRTRLLDAAERSVRACGYDGFSYADLSRDVGIRKASIHYHFPAKADLSLALMQRYHAALRARCAEIDADCNKAGARIAALIELYRGALCGGKSLCLCAAFSISRDGLSKDLIAQMCDFRAMMREWIAAIFALGLEDDTIANVGDPGAEAAATLALLEGAQLAARSEEDIVRFDDAAKILAGRIIRA